MPLEVREIFKYEGAAPRCWAWPIMVVFRNDSQVTAVLLQLPAPADAIYGSPFGDDRPGAGHGDRVRSRCWLERPAGQRDAYRRHRPAPPLTSLGWLSGFILRSNLLSTMRFHNRCRSL